MASLNTHIHVTDDSGRAHVFAPGDDVPPWACAKITAPGVWAVPPGDEPGPSDEEIARAEEAAAREAEAAAAAADRTPSGDPGTGDATRTPQDAMVPVPPKGGPGSGRPAWAEYAAANGIVVTDEMRSRDDIIAALDLAGVPTV